MYIYRYNMHIVHVRVITLISPVLTTRLTYKTKYAHYHIRSVAGLYIRGGV
jgi:hypothetical protein